ncbi:6-phosphogluconolactonase [Microbacterium sp. No. 7]|uniref:6-phosphogluconolactonase n=1 Tax=Microbacterium sp. No. 7 TaxID=1714373 RepID=UPI0006D01D1E|nr:6-phosphogluconolactonase [Microbacterium sp. No. 7]ALJ20747.1 6-phosphogluconolactonase [Microbacterium sp. No. 7]
MNRSEKRVVVSADATQLALTVAQRFLNVIGSTIASGETAHVALTGGTTGTRVLEAIGMHPDRLTIDWSRVHFWWGDERFVAWDSTERNEQAARAAFLRHIDVPGSHVHAIAASDEGVTLEQAADAYAVELARFGGEAQAWPSFDVCFLGVGPDGHVASLFPDRGEIQVRDRSTVPVRNSPKPPPERVSLTRPVINAAQRVWMVVGGADKASALGLALAGASYETVPAAGAKGQLDTVFFIDRAAARDVPADLIEQDED